jgi:hypothetical protein
LDDGPFSPFVLSGTAEPTVEAVGHGLDLWDDLYRRLGALGWEPSDVAGWELWQAASFLGAGEREPVIRGTRDGLRLPRDNETQGSGGGSWPPRRDTPPDPDAWARMNRQ